MEVVLVESNVALGSEVTPMVNGFAFPLKMHVCSVGMVLDPTLPLAVAAKTVYFQLQLVCQLQTFLEKKHFTRVIDRLTIIHFYPLSFSLPLLTTCFLCHLSLALA